MATSVDKLPDTTTVATPAHTRCGDWALYEYPVVTSTNLVGAALPAWNAVRADTQTKGRGRFQRTWVSDRGGLWLSAVVPFAEEPIFRRALPLAIGVAICDVLKELGVTGFRLRWPNDVLVKERKLAGLLIDQFSPDVAVVGIGLNVTNHPETADPHLKNQTTRLADLLTTPPELPTLTSLVLRHVRAVLAELAQAGATCLFARANELWNCPRNIELDLDGAIVRGLFNGIDAQGRLILTDDPSRTPSFYDAHQVRHLTEL